MGQRILESYNRFWDDVAACADTDPDGLINREEFRHGIVAAFIDQQRPANTLQPLVQAIVDLCDSDGDGHLGRDEFNALQTAYATTPANARLAFSKLDLDGDGRLSVDELTSAIIDFYTSPDPDTAGSWLFGQPPPSHRATQPS